MKWWRWLTRQPKSGSARTTSRPKVAPDRSSLTHLPQSSDMCTLRLTY